MQISDLTLSAPVNSRSTPGGGQTNERQQQHPQGESSTNRQQQQQRPQSGESTNGNQQEGTPFQDSQQPGGNARQENAVVHVTPRHPDVGQEVVRRLSQIAEDQEENAPSNGTTSPGTTSPDYALTGSPANGLPEDNDHQDGTAANSQPGTPIDPTVSEAPPVQRRD